MKEISEEQKDKIIELLDWNISDHEEIEDIEHGEDGELIITTRLSEYAVSKYSLKLEYQGYYEWIKCKNQKL